MEQFVLNFFRDVLAQPFNSLIIAFLAAVVGLGFYILASWYGKNEQLQSYRATLEVVAQGVVPIIFRLAFPESQTEAFKATLDEYEEIAKTREGQGLSWVDPRMLYAIDRLEVMIEEANGVKIDFNVLLDLAEGYYQQLKSSGQLSK